VGDMRRFLTCLISLKEDPPSSGNIDKVSRDYLFNRGCDVKTIKDAK
jgi:hypothetical protein